MDNRSFRSKLARYMDAGFPIIYINTYEEDKVDSILNDVRGGKDICEWNETNGFIDFDTKAPKIEDYTLEQTLDSYKNADLLERNILLLKDVNAYLEEPRIISKLKGLARMICQGIDANIIIVSSRLIIPKELEQFIDEFALAFKGLTEFEINNLLALSYSQNGELDRSDLRLIFDQKQQMIKKAGILEMIPLKETIDDIGGLDNLKEWLRRKASVYRNIEKAKRFGVDMPKGVLIAGVPGCGKSLNAKAAAALFEIPLLRMDMGRLMGKYVGESEENMRNAIALTEAISPCVLWIDELEKAFAGIGGSGGAAEVTTRLFGNFLTWMQEKDSPTFVVATANKIVQLPPELMRKGRFDEIFYVGLPNQTERENIFRIHIQKRRPQDMKIIDLKELARNTDGYSGADIEGVIKDAVEAAFADGKDHISTQDILDVIRTTHSLSEVMKDSIDAMEKEYKRCKFRNASSDRR